MEGKEELFFKENRCIIENSGLGNIEVHAKQIENSCRLSQTERPRSNRFWTFKRYPFTSFKNIFMLYILLESALLKEWQKMVQILSKDF